MNKTAAEKITALYLSHFGAPPLSVETLPASGSGRIYFRLRSNGTSVIAAFNADKEENAAFISFSLHFASKGIPVPAILAQNQAEGIYLQQDLGDNTLLQEVIQSGSGAARIKNLYRQALQGLISLQTRGIEGLDESLIIGRQVFDAQAMLWDLNYFKYNFLRMSYARYSEDALEKDFSALVNLLAAAPNHYFMHRDFQARNLMIHQEKPWIIDHQGGKRGPLQYDVASLLYQAKAGLPESLRSELLDFYLSELAAVSDMDRSAFERDFPGFVLLRILQTLGAYGFRGYFERKPHFLESIPAAVENALALLQHPSLPALPEIRAALESVRDRQSIKNKIKNGQTLTVRVSSFSYREVIPPDPSGNGGGFVFDCRAIDNPGRHAEYMYLSGLDAPVVHFLQSQTTFPSFLQDVFSLVDRAVTHYLQRGFTHLMVNFGCTGGQHRSVASAEALAKHLRTLPGVVVILEHTARSKWKKNPEAGQ